MGKRLIPKRSKERLPRGTCKNDREQQVYYKFGLLPKEYQALKDSQNNACAICGTLPSGSRNGKYENLAIDHCHDKLVVRGLLCLKCNTALGKFDDNILFLERAIEYLKNN